MDATGLGASEAPVYSSTGNERATTPSGIHGSSPKGWVEKEPLAVLLAWSLVHGDKLPGSRLALGPF